MKLEMLIRIAGTLHFCILLASALTPFALKWNANLALMPRLMRQMFWVYGGFIVLVIVGFGTLILTHAPDIAAGHPLGRALSGFIAAFWLARLSVQFFVFDARPYLTNWFFRCGYHGLTAVFSYFVAVFIWAALAP